VNANDPHEFGEQYDQLLQQLAGDRRKNLLEVIELVAKRNNLHDVDLDRSIALVSDGELFIHIVYGDNEHTNETHDTDSDIAKDLLSEAGRLIADNMRDSVERLRIIEKQ
jgi:hypothetical protein